MCYILKLFYLCASSTKSNKREEESSKSNLDAANTNNSLATKEAAAVNKKLDVQNNNQPNIVIKTELSEFICTNEKEEDRLSAKLEFNENEIYEIETANKALLAKKSKKKGTSLLSQTKKKKASNNSAVSSSSASCSSSSVVEVEKKPAGVVVTSNQLPTEDSSSYSLYEYVRDPKVGKQLRKKTNTLEEFPGEENYFTRSNENEAILLTSDKNKSSYLDFLQLGSSGYNRSNAFDYSSLDRFSMTEMDPQGQQAAFRQANDKAANSSATDKQDAVSQNNTDTNSLNSDASSSSMSNDPRQFLSNNQKLPLNANESLFDHLQKSFNSLNLSEDQRKFINPAPSTEPDASRSAAKSKLELFQNKAKFNVSIDNSNLYNNQSVRLAHELAIDPNEPNRMSTSTELINNTASFLSRAGTANNSSSTRLNLGGGGGGGAAAGQGLTLLGENANKNLSTSLSMFNGGQPPRLRPSLMGGEGRLSTSKLDDRGSDATSPKSQIQIKLQQPELKLDQLKKKKQGFYFETNNLLAMPNETMLGDKELSLMLDDELSNSNLNEDEDISSSASSLHPNRSKSRHSDIEKHHRHHNSKLDYNKLQKGGKITITANQVSSQPIARPGRSPFLIRHLGH